MTGRPNLVLKEWTIETSDRTDAPFFELYDLRDEPVPEVDWLVEGLIPNRNVTLMSGDGGVGKSLAALGLAIAVTAGPDWLGRPTTAGPVVYVSAEDDKAEIHRRSVAILKATGKTLASIRYLYVMPLAYEDPVLARMDREAGEMTPTPRFEQLVAFVKHKKPVLVILDAAADVFGGDEIKRTETRQFLAMLRAMAGDHNLAVLLLAHPSKSGRLDNSGISGSTAWSNSVRSMLYMEHVKPKEGEKADRDLRTLRVKKANYTRGGTTSSSGGRTGTSRSNSRRPLRRLRHEPIACSSSCSISAGRLERTSRAYPDQVTRRASWRRAMGTRASLATTSSEPWIAFLRQGGSNTKSTARRPSAGSG